MRFGVVIALFTCTLFIAAAIGLLPSYLSEKEQTDALVKQKQDAEAQNTVESLAEADAKITKNKAIAEYLQARIPAIETDHARSLSIEKIFSKKTPSVAISSISFEGRMISVIGIAATRSELISFNNSLKSDSHFKNASLPIADIARSVDAPFTIQIELP